MTAAKSRQRRQGQPLTGKEQKEMLNCGPSEQQQQQQQQPQQQQQAGAGKRCKKADRQKQRSKRSPTDTDSRDTQPAPPPPPPLPDNASWRLPRGSEPNGSTSSPRAWASSGHAERETTGREQSLSVATTFNRSVTSKVYTDERARSVEWQSSLHRPASRLAVPGHRRGSMTSAFSGWEGGMSELTEVVPRAFAVGDIVVVRDSSAEAWQRGTIVSLAKEPGERPFVLLDAHKGTDRAFTWKQMELSACDRRSSGCDEDGEGVLQVEIGPDALEVVPVMSLSYEKPPMLKPVQQQQQQQPQQQQPQQQPQQQQQHRKSSLPRHRSDVADRGARQKRRDKSKSGAGRRK